MERPVKVNALKRVLSVFIMLFCLVAFCIAAYAYENGDFQIWNTNAQDIKIGKTTKFTMEEEYRYAETASELFYQHYDWGFAWAFDKRFELALGYRLVLDRIRHKWMEGDEPYINLTWRQDIGKFRFEDRNRIEYRHYRFADDNVRYRNKFVLKYPFEFKTIKVILHTSDEIFVVSNGRGFNNNRFQSGIEMELTKYVKFDVSYMLQSSRGKGDKWYEANVLWLKNKISF